jgi:hypothetical protein
MVNKRVTSVPGPGVLSEGGHALERLLVHIEPLVREHVPCFDEVSDRVRDKVQRQKCRDGRSSALQAARVWILCRATSSRT